VSCNIRSINFTPKDNVFNTALREDVRNCDHVINITQVLRVFEDLEIQITVYRGELTYVLSWPQRYLVEPCQLG
jgi:hypothetical protein